MEITKPSISNYVALQDAVEVNPKKAAETVDQQNVSGQNPPTSNTLRGLLPDPNVALQLLAANDVKGASSGTVSKAREPMPAIAARGTADATDVALVRAELEKIPPKYRQMLMDNNVQIIVTRNSVTEYRTDLKGVQPRGWRSSATWDTVPGVGPTPERNEIVIATRGHGTPAGPRVPLTGDGHNSYNLVLHEAAHALQENQSIGFSWQAFKDARTADFAKLSSYEKQADDAGLQETFAESFANVFGGNRNYANTHPHLDKYWKELP